MATLRTKIFVTLLGAFFCVMFLSAHHAFAHATPVEYEPEVSSLLSAVPHTIKIHFSEHVEEGASSVRIFAPDGSDALEGSPTTGTDTSIYNASVQDRGEGTYTVSWAVVSADDGHFTKGAFSFSVGKVTASEQASKGQVQIQHLTSMPEAVTIWFELLGQAFLVATCVFLFFIWPFIIKRFPEVISQGELIRKRLQRFVVGGGILMLIGGISFLILKTFDLEQLRSTTFWPTLWTFVRTANGAYTVYRLIAALLFGVLFFKLYERAALRGLRSLQGSVMFACILFILFGRTVVSHAAATHFHPYFSIFVHTVHLFFKELWIGAPLLCLILLFPLFKTTNNRQLFTSTLLKLSEILSIAFGAISVTGAYIVWIDLKNPDNLTTTEWGSRFITLFILSGIWVAIRLYHHVIADRAVYASGEQSASSRTRTLTSFLKASLALEFMIGMSVLLVTSYLIITTPPYSAQQFLFETHTTSQGENISLKLHPYESKKFLVTITDKNQRPENNLTNLIVSLKNDEQSIGPLTAPVEEYFPGGYVFPTSLLSPPGPWHITITAQRADKYDAVASFNLNYPQDIEATHVNPDRRSFGPFETLLVVGCLFILAIMTLMLLYNRKLSFAASKNTPENVSTPFVSGYIAWGAATLGSVGLIALTWLFYNTFATSNFQKQCEKDGNFWLQSVPMRNGLTLSSDTVTGCTLNVGLNHFADINEYRYFLRTATTAPDLTVTPKTPTVGQEASLTIALQNVQDGRSAGPITDLSIEHDRLMHVIIVSEDLKSFAHIHAEDFGAITPEMIKNGRFNLRYTFPKAGRYTIAVNYYVRAQQFLFQFFVDVAGNPKMDPQDNDLSRTKNIEGYDIKLDAPQQVKAGTLTKLTYTIMKDGRPVTDINPYLSAGMHIGILDQDLQSFVHAHGSPPPPASAAIQAFFERNYANFHNHFVPDTFGPTIEARVTFPHPGLYRIFGEFKHQGKVIPTSFMVKVE